MQRYSETKMQVLGREIIINAGKHQPDRRASLNSWFRISEGASRNHFPDVRQTFNSADNPADNRVIFNIAHNKAKLLTIINYTEKRVTVLDVLTHAEYDKKDWTK
jgi:mRNA interferase HigB